MKQYLVFIIFVITSSVLSAQSSTDITLQGMPTCAFNQVLQKANVTHAQLIQAYRQNPTNTGNVNAVKRSIVYDIPVVFHIVYAASQVPFNLPDSIIINQVQVLNTAFRKQHADTGNTRAIFKPLSEDAEIQFHLAGIDPQGNSTSGITRTISTRHYFGGNNGSLDSLERMKHNDQGGIDAWPTDRYLNIWVANLSDSKGQLTVMGYGVPPLNPLPGNWPAGTETTLAGLIDGVVIQVHTVGNNNALSAQLQGLYTKGRAAVHEVGHYLGLQHVFGGNNTASPACGTIANDGIDDTPEQSTMSFTSGCPSATKNSCGIGEPNDLPDMWENYMDYAVDACQNMFTKDQVSIMRSVMGVQRAKLLTINRVSALPANALYPNPAGNTINVSYPGTIDKLTVLDFTGQTVIQLKDTDANSKAYDTSDLATGNYFILMECEGKLMTGRFVISR